MKNWLIGSLAGLAGVLMAGCAANGGGPVATAPPTDFLRTNAEVAVVDFFDMYCHSCQSAASHVNDLHAEVAKRGLGSKIAFYAIGWGNTEMEADLYRTRFKVPFPVIADRELTISKRYGEFRPPLLLALRREGGTWKEIYRTKDPAASSGTILTAIGY